MRHLVLRIAFGLVFAWGVGWGALAGRDAAPRAVLRSGLGHWGVGALPKESARRGAAEARPSLGRRQELIDSSVIVLAVVLVIIFVIALGWLTLVSKDK